MGAGKLKIDVRRSKIVDQVCTEGRVSVSQLSQSLDASVVTIRNDLAELEREGHLTRIQGGAIRVEKQDHTFNPFGDAEISHLECKQEISKVILGLVRDGDTLFANSGTTTLCIAEALNERKNLNVVTNSLAVATKLGTAPSMRVSLLGGEINAHYGFTYGGYAQEQLSRYQADWAVLSVGGVSVSGGVTTYHAEESILDRMMMTNAKNILIAADHSKIGRVGFIRLCSCSDRIRLVTDSLVDQEQLAALSEQGLSIFKP